MNDYKKKTYKALMITHRLEAVLNQSTCQFYMWRFDRRDIKHRSQPGNWTEWPVRVTTQVSPLSSSVMDELSSVYLRHQWF